MSEVTAVPIRPLARGAVLKLWLAILALALAAGALAWWGTRPLQRTTTASGLEYQVIQEGEGDTVTPADLVRIHYVGRLENGRIFEFEPRRAAGRNGRDRGHSGLRRGAAADEARRPLPALDPAEPWLCGDGPDPAAGARSPPATP